MIFIYAGKKRGTIPAPFITPATRVIEQKLRHDLEQLILLHGEFKLTPEFISTWAEWYINADNNPPFTDNILSAYCERRPAMVMKLSMIMSTSRGDEMIIRGEDLLRAINTLEEAEQTMPLALSGIGKGIHADVLSRIMIDISSSEEITLEELLWKYRNDITKFELEQLLQGLEAMKFCTYMFNTRKIVYNIEFDRK